MAEAQFTLRQRRREFRRVVRQVGGGRGDERVARRGRRARVGECTQPRGVGHDPHASQKDRAGRTARRVCVQVDREDRVRRAGQRAGHLDAGRRGRNVRQHRRRLIVVGSGRQGDAQQRVAVDRVDANRVAASRGDRNAVAAVVGNRVGRTVRNGAAQKGPQARAGTVADLVVRVAGDVNPVAAVSQRSSKSSVGADMRANHHVVSRAGHLDAVARVAADHGRQGRVARSDRVSVGARAHINAGIVIRPGDLARDIGADVAVADRNIVRVAGNGHAVVAIRADRIARDDVERGLRAANEVAVGVAVDFDPVVRVAHRQRAVGVQAHDVAGHAYASGVAANLDAVVAVLGDHVGADEDAAAGRGDQHAVVAIAERRLVAEGRQAAERVVRGEDAGGALHDDAIQSVGRIHIAQRNRPAHDRGG